MLASVLAIACQNKKQQPAAGSAGSGIAGSAGSPVAKPTAGSAGDYASEIVLPKSTKTPPVKTTTPVDQPRLEKLAAIDFDGFNKDKRRLEKTVLDIRYTTRARPKLAVTINVAPCFDCKPMVDTEWKKDSEAMKQLLAEELRNRPDTVFEIATADLYGARVISQYQLGYFFGDEGGAYSHAYALYFNDGVNFIRVVAEYKDDPPSSRQDMINLAPREDLEKLARAFLDVYTHAWQ
jgi:hypothetical protein